MPGTGSTQRIQESEIETGICLREETYKHTLHTHKQTCKYTHIHIYRDIHTYTHIHIHRNTQAYTHMCRDIHTHIHNIHTYIHIHIDLYTHT